MKNRVLSTFTLILDIALVALVGLSIVSFHTPLFGEVTTSMSVYLYFTTLSNIFVGAVALLEIPFLANSIAKRRYLVPTWLRATKLAAVTCVSVTMITALTWLTQVYGFEEMVKGVNLFLHVITPAVALVSFLLIDAQCRIKFRKVFYVLIPMVAYIAFYFLAIFVLEVGDKDWYHVAYDWTASGHSEQVNILKSVLSIVIFLVAPLVLSILIWGINQLLYKAYFVRKPLPHPEDTRTPEGKKVVIIEENKKAEEVESVKEEAPVEEAAIEETPEEAEEVVEKPVEEPEEELVEEAKEPEVKEEKPAKKASAKAAKKPAEKKEPAKKAAPKKAAAPVTPSEFGKYEGKTRVYHISQSKTVDGQWQVKLAGGDRAVKIFKTQKEAIEFAKGLVRTQGGSIRIHSMKGKMRK